MERVRFSRDSTRESKGPLALQKKLAESKKPNSNKPEHVPDLTDFMNDMFFGAVVSDEKKTYNLTGGGDQMEEEESASFDDSVRSNNSRLTQEWLEEARRMVATPPSRCDSPSRLSGSPRFAAVPGRLSASSLDRRDPQSRSARRHRGGDGFSGEILSKSAKHGRNNSLSFEQPPTATAATPSEISPASAVHKWFSNILKPTPQPNQPPISTTTTVDPTATILPPRQSTTHRKSRFQTDLNAAPPQAIQVPSRRTFKTPTPLPGTQLLSPPKNFFHDSPPRKSVSLSENRVLSPPRNLVESANRRSISSSTCSTDKIAPRPIRNGFVKEDNSVLEEKENINGFLKEQKIKIEMILKGEVNLKAKMVLSGPTNSTSSMVAAICYSWLLENRLRKEKGGSDGDGYVVVPVMNVKRVRMWKQRQAAWLFHHVGLDATSLLFADEVDLESLMMSGKLNILVVGQDILKPNSEVGSQCTILTDNYCEDAYDLLQTPVLKKLLLAGILLDTQNLNASGNLSMTRDAEAVQLLLVGSAPNYKNDLFDQLMQDQKENSFFEALRHNYGKSPSESGGGDIGAHVDHGFQEKSTSKSNHEAKVQNSDKNSNDMRNGKAKKVSPKSEKPNALPTEAPKTAPAQTAPNGSRGKNTFFLAKWFGFGSK